MSDPQPDAFGRFIGGLLIAVGALVALLSGACTLSMSAPLLAQAGRGVNGEGAGLGLALIFIVGGLPCLGGLAVAWLGWSIVRPRKRPGADVFGERPPPPDA